MDEKIIDIDVEVIKKPKICKLCFMEASFYESSLQKAVSTPNKWQGLKNCLRNKINREKSLKKN